MTITKTGPKINFYKFVPPVRVSGTGVSKDPSQQTNLKLQLAFNKNVQATNNLGATVNSIAKILTEFRNSQAQLVSNLKQNEKKFQAIYAKPTGGPEMGELEEGEVPETQMPGWLESIFSIVKDFLTLAIGVPVMQWLADPKNREAVKSTIETIVTVVKWVSEFISDRVKGTIDNLYDLFTKDEPWWEKIGTFFKAVVNFAGLVIAIRWLSNPMKIVKDFKSVMNLFRRNLRDSKKQLTRRQRLMRGGLAATVLVTAGVGIYQGFNQPSEDDDDKDENARGGKLKQRAAGGFINGPMSGYPVSLDGGRSTAFIGHGLEYVAQKSGGGFVVPINTPATQNNPGLMGKRMTEANRMGFDLGGMTLNNEMKFYGAPEFAQGGGISLTSNGGRPLMNKRLEPGKTYRYQDLKDHSHNPTTRTIYDGIAMGAGKDYGVGKLPQYMPSGPNGKIPTPQSGKVLRAGDINNGYGKSVLVKGPLGVMGFHHLSSIASGVQQGRSVSKGKILGVQGKTGGNYADHLHLNASPKGHEAFVNFITTGRPTTGSAGDSGSPAGLSLTVNGPAHKAVGRDKEFLKEVVRVSRKIGVHPADLLGLMASESGLDPQARNKSGATGLIQFMPDTAAELGTSVSALSKMNRVQQMKYVEKFLLKKVPKGATPGHLYTAVFLPKFAKRPANYVIAKRGGFTDKYGNHPAKWYTGNAGLDLNKDGSITIAELGDRIQQKKKSFGIMGGGSSGSNFISPSTDEEGRQGMEPAIPTDPLAAMKALTSSLSSVFGGGMGADESSVASSASEASSGKSIAPDKASDSGHFRSGGSSPSSASQPVRMSPSTASSAGGASSPTGSVTPPKAKATSSASPSVSTQIMSQTTQTMQSRQVVRQQQGAAIQQLQTAAAVQAARTRQLSEQSQKAVADAQTAENNKQSTVIATGGARKTRLVSQLNSSNNLLKSRQ